MKQWWVMTKCVALMLVLSTGCGTIFNKDHKFKYVSDPGVSIEGGDGVLDQKKEYRVTYSDGSTCTLEPSMSWSYFFLDLFFTGPIGIIVDAATGNWKILKGCDGVERVPD
jgi:hypothetical protein